MATLRFYSQLLWEFESQKARALLTNNKLAYDYWVSQVEVVRGMMWGAPAGG